MPFSDILLSQGPLGLICALLLWLFLAERKKAATEQTARLHTVEKHHDEIDIIRLAQIEREKTFSKTLEDYGHSVLIALDRINFLSEELRKIYNERFGA